MAVVLQSLRLIIPMPLQLSTFIIGTLVHMMLVFSCFAGGRSVALLIGCLLPLFAYAQGQLLLPVLIPIVILGNSLFVLLLPKPKEHLLTLRGCVFPPLAKACAMGLGAFVLLVIVGLANPAIQKVLMFGMTVPQLITGVAGVVFANYLLKKLKI